jgi:hypothetical protein
VVIVAFPSLRALSLPFLPFRSDDSLNAAYHKPRRLSRRANRERQWYDEVYRDRGDSLARLTWRAVLIARAWEAGMVAGFA